MNIDLKEQQIYPYIPPGDNQLYHDQNNNLAFIVNHTFQIDSTNP